MAIKITYWRAEWLRFRRDRANLLVLVLFTLLALAAALNGVREVRLGAATQQQATLAAEQRLARMRQEVQAIAPDRPLLTQGVDPASPAKLANGDGSFRVALPPTVGAALAHGTTTVLPQSIEVSTRSRHTQAANQKLGNPANLGAGSFDLAFMVTTLLPLAAIALAWRVQAYDRELGTWRLIAAVPGAARGLLVSALLLRLALLCLAAWFAGAVAVFGHAGFGAEAWGAWGSYALIVLLTALLWLVLAALLNATALPSPTVALGLVGLWLLALFVVPAAIDASAPVAPSRLVSIAKLRALDALSQTDGEALEQSYRAAHPEAMPGALTPQQGDYRIRLFSTQLAFDHKAAPLVREVDAAVAARQAWVERWSWLSPVLAAQLALEHASGSDLERHQHFMAQVDVYQDRWRDYFRPLVLSLRNLRAADYDGIPRFSYSAMAMTSAPLARTAAAVATWLLFCALALMATVRYRRAPAGRPAGAPDFSTSPNP